MVIEAAQSHVRVSVAVLCVLRSHYIEADRQFSDNNINSDSWHVLIWYPGPSVVKNMNAWGFSLWLLYFSYCAIISKGNPQQCRNCGKGST
jgi:hypothetical protein